MEAALSPREFGYMENRSTRFGWMTLLAAGLVGIMIFTSVWMNGGTPPPDDGNDLAWAPGMGSPESSPVVTCTVEPLTSDEVMAMVMNPSNGYVRLGFADYQTNEDQLFESAGYSINDEPDKTGYIRNGDVEMLHDAAVAANMYSNCAQTGTLYQVWAIMDPAIVQLDILSRFPVLRNDEQLRTFVEKWGPEQFPGDGHGIIGRFPGHVKTENGSDWIGSTMIDGRVNDLAIISIFDTNPVEGQAPVRTEISLQLFPNGQWIVTGIHPIGLRG